MHPDRRPIVGGNWKMNTLREEAVRLARAVDEGVRSMARMEDGSSAPPAVPACEVVIFPPYPWLLSVAQAVTGGAIAVGAQDLCHKSSGAFTGQVSAAMILDAGASWVIIGHSERRHVAGESDQLCGEKLQMALESGLRVIFCVGETWEQRSAGSADEVNARQLSAGFRAVSANQLERVAIAYEPVWAIGTGRTASPRDADEAHRAIRAWLASRYDPQSVQGVRILYGGSVNASNAVNLFARPEIDGGLIGGASLKPTEFLAIVAAASESPTDAST